jgi:hypothetical protein
MVFTTGKEAEGSEVGIPRRGTSHIREVILERSIGKQESKEAVKISLAESGF